MKVRLLAIAMCLFASTISFAQMEDVVIKATKVTDSIYMLQGRGGNIGVSFGNDGVFLIDDQFAPLTEKIKKAVSDLSDKSIKFVVNTHWHGDHTGGNENLGKEGAMIVAHDNVRARMSHEQVSEAINSKAKPAPEAALPVITFSRQMTFHFNGEEIRVIHMPRSHTDGDSLLHFVDSNVIHTGDLVFNGAYPYIDTSSGGGTDGVIAAAEKIIAMSDENTQIIPGHGKLAKRDDIVKYHAMLVDVKARLTKYLNDGLSLSAVEVRDPLKDYNEEWGNGFMKPEVFLRIVYTDLSEQ